MSGLCGIVDRRRPVHPADLDRLMVAGAHRGPDGGSTGHVGGASFGHLAHSVMVADGHRQQPVRADDLLLVADARIDNRPELLHRFGWNAGLTDPELLVALHRRLGPAFIDELIGDFAIALWDGRRKALLLARDPMGMRPLFHHRQGDRLLFASEIAQLLADPAVPRRLDERSLARHLVNDYRFGGATFYQEIHEVEPGHVVEWKGGEPSSRRWHSFRHVEPISGRDEGEHVEHFLDVFGEAVRCRLPEQGRAGILLSGGMDSTSVASVAGNLREADPASFGEPLRSYSFAYDTLTECDERHVSSLIVDRFGFASTDVSAEHHHPLSDPERHGPHVDTPYHGVFQPVIDACLAAAAADGVSVMLGGDRGDLISGVFWLDYLRLIRDPRLLVAAIDGHRRATGERLPRIVLDELVAPLVGRSLRIRPRHLVRAVGRSSHREPAPEGAGPNPPWIDVAFAQRVGLAGLRGSDAESAAAALAVAPGWMGEGLARRWNAHRVEVVLDPVQMQSVVWSNRTYAAHGLAFADPWSDVRLAEWAMAVPQQLLGRGRSPDKRFIRTAMTGVMPERARSLVGKRWPSPLWKRAVTEWQADRIRQLFTGGELQRRGVVSESAVLDHHQRLTADGPIRPEFWSVVAAELWLRAHWGSE